MEIIKKGRKKYLDYIEYVRKCSRCKCTFTYKESDFRNNKLKANYMCDLVYCPRCLSKNNIDIWGHKIYKKHYAIIDD